jgi:general secretion pathway protein C
VFGGQVMSLTPDTAVLLFGGDVVRLRLRAAARDFTASMPEPPAAEPAPAAEAPPAPRTMEKREVERRLAGEMTRILADTALAPVMEDGRIAGMTLTRIAEGTVLSDAGLRAGDVLKEVNGTRIDGMATLLGLWTRLRSATELNAVVLRNGQPVSLRVTLR